MFFTTNYWRYMYKTINMYIIYVSISYFLVLYLGAPVFSRNSRSPAGGPGKVTGTQQQQTLHLNAPLWLPIKGTHSGFVGESHKLTESVLFPSMRNCDPPNLRMTGNRIMRVDFVRKFQAPISHWEGMGHSNTSTSVENLHLSPPVTTLRSLTGS